MRFRVQIQLNNKRDSIYITISDRWFRRVGELNFWLARMVKNDLNLCVEWTGEKDKETKEWTTMIIDT